MIIHKERAAILLFVAAILVVGVLALGGCQSAGESTTTSASDTTGTGETTTTAVSGGTTTTAGTGSTGTTTPGSAVTTAPPESVAPVSEQFKICTDCHSNFNAFLARQGQKVLTNKFSHAVHLNKGFKCEDCHLVPTHKPDKIVKPTMQKCFACHSQEAGAVAPGACSACHPADFPLVPASHSTAGWIPAANTTGVKTVSAKHDELAKQDVTYCQMCHADSFCLSCHKTPMPHASDWTKVHPQTVSKVGEAACATCHPDKWLCNDCHHKGYKNDGTGWKTQHPPITKSAGTDACFTCHSPLTCAHCHITGELDMKLKPTS